MNLLSPGWFTVFTLVLPLLIFILLVGKFVEISAERNFIEQYLYSLVPLSAGGVLVSLAPKQLFESFIEFDLFTVVFLTIIFMGLVTLLKSCLEIPGVGKVRSWLHNILLAAGITLGGVFLLTFTVIFLGSLFRSPIEIELEEDSAQIERYNEFVEETESFAEIELPEPSDTEAAVVWLKEPPVEFTTLREILLEEIPSLPGGRGLEAKNPQVMNFIKAGRIYSTARDYYLKSEVYDKSVLLTSEQVIMGHNLFVNERALISALVGIPIHNFGFKGIQEHLKRSPETRSKLWQRIEPILRQDYEFEFLSGERKYWLNHAVALAEGSVVDPPWREYKVISEDLLMDPLKLGEYMNYIYREADKATNKPLPAVDIEDLQPDDPPVDIENSFFIQTLNSPRAPLLPAIIEMAFMDLEGVAEEKADLYTTRHCMLSLLAPEEVWNDLDERQRTDFQTGETLEFRDDRCFEAIR